MASETPTCAFCGGPGPCPSCGAGGHDEEGLVDFRPQGLASRAAPRLSDTAMAPPTGPGGTPDDTGPRPLQGEPPRPRTQGTHPTWLLLLAVVLMALAAGLAADTVLDAQDAENAESLLSGPSQVPDAGQRVLPPAPSTTLVPTPPADPDAVPRPQEPDAPPDAPEDQPALGAAQDGVYERTYTWKYGKSRWEHTTRIQETDYDTFRERERPLRLIDKDDGLARQHAYDIYVSEPHDDVYLQALADEFTRIGEEKGWSTDERVSFALAFVQSLPYTQDDVTSGFDEYPRFPLETLVDGGGDCEDTSILFASILQAMGYGVVMLSPPGHMAVGVQAGEDVPGSAYTIDGVRYLYAETTGQGWRLGDVPEAYQGKSAQVFDLRAKPLLSLDVTMGDLERGWLPVTVEVRNHGSTDGLNVEVFGGLHKNDGLYRDTTTCPIERVRPGQTQQCSLALDVSTVPQGEAVQIVVTVGDGTYLHDRLQSGWWTPRP